MLRSVAAAAVLEMPDPGSEDIRLRALERLYLRREAVDELIRSLEHYQGETDHLAPCIPISVAARKCS